ncbi:hypothetical protein ES702_03852 [subsurface metagenome]
MIRKVVGDALTGRTFNNSLDLGCGFGDGGALVKPHTVYLIGVDLDPSALSEAKHRGVYDEFHEGDMKNYPWGSADSVFLFDTIEHISKEEGKELLRKLRGRFTMLTTPWHSLSLLSPWGAWDGHRCVWSSEELQGEGFTTEGYSFLPDPFMVLQYGGITLAVRE